MFIEFSVLSVGISIVFELVNSFERNLSKNFIEMEIWSSIGPIVRSIVRSVRSLEQSIG